MEIYKTESRLKLAKWFRIIAIIWGLVAFPFYPLQAIIGAIIAFFVYNGLFISEESFWRRLAEIMATIAILFFVIDIVVIVSIVLYVF
jgi:hypothetical protein